MQGSEQLVTVLHLSPPTEAGPLTNGIIYIMLFFRQRNILYLGI
jgi:hypothetical protein